MGSLFKFLDILMITAAARRIKNFRTWVGLINRYNNFFFMLGFFPFLSWWGILANIQQRKKGSDVMFGSIFFNIDSASLRSVLAFTDNN